METPYPPPPTSSTPNIINFPVSCWILSGQHWSPGHPDVEVNVIEQGQGDWRVAIDDGEPFSVDPEHLRHSDNMDGVAALTSIPVVDVADLAVAYKALVDEHQQLKTLLKQAVQNEQARKTNLPNGYDLGFVEGRQDALCGVLASLTVMLGDDA